jgi:hypothetical protein
LAGDVVGHVDVQALRLEVGADEAIGREVGGDRDLDFLCLEDVVQGGLRLDAGGGQQAGQGQAEGEVSFVHGRTLWKVQAP